MRIPVVSGIASLAPALERAVGGYPALAGVSIVRVAPERAAADALWREAEVALADPGLVAGAALDAARGLRWLQSTWAGVNALQGGRRDFACTKLSGCFGPPIAEHVFAHVLRAERRVDELRAAQGEARWDADGFKAAWRPLGGQTLGVLGAGDIGRHVAGVAKAFGMRTLGYARDARPRANFDEVSADADAVVRASDVLLAALPSTPATRGLLDDGRLERCEKCPMFLNVGRGDVVSEASVVAALDAGKIREAVLDVFADEPLPAASPLWAHPGVRVTPHVAALSTPGDVARVFAENLDRYLRGAELLYPVDWDAGY
mmetsp:Transcript_12205/g.36258  ORF Transcript_12205/g.36258 Transcript_12205/m.36258 type:complete len:318 (+) Transcript_12205:229-1182(+)